MSVLAQATSPPSAKRLHEQALAELDSPRFRARLRRRLLAWFARHARDLPWRRTRDPYCVWVSEIMLQQTVVATVIPYFTRFIERFPTAVALAEADESEVLRLWEGLGYYRRARQLHRAAGEIRDQHGGRFPRDAQMVRALPGVGRYTAGAILSIAFDDAQPILEANTVRLLARLLAFGGDTTSTLGQRLLWGTAERLLPRRGAGTFNQALMELGSQVCTPRNPRCDACPLAALCPTRRWHLADKIPAPKVKAIIEEVREAAIVVRRGRRVLLVQRQAGERWAGMWDFPRFPLSDAKHDGDADEIVLAVARATGQHVKPGRLLTTIRHSVTRFRIMLSCYEATHVRPAAGPRRKRAMKWVSPAELANYPLSTSARKLARLVAGIP